MINRFSLEGPEKYSHCLEYTNQEGKTFFEIYVK